MIKRNFLLSLLVAVLLGTLCAPAHAAFGYSGSLDPETGEPLQSSDGSDAYSVRVTVSEGVYYDRSAEVLRPSIRSEAVFFLLS